MRDFYHFVIISEKAVFPMNTRYELNMDVPPREAIRLMYVSKSRFGGDWNSVPLLILLRMPEEDIQALDREKSARFRITVCRTLRF